MDTRRGFGVRGFARISVKWGSGYEWATKTAQWHTLITPYSRLDTATKAYPHTPHKPLHYLILIILDPTRRRAGGLRLALD